MNFNRPGTSATVANTPTNSTNNLKFIVIDGSNVAREHGKDLGNVFSSRGIRIVVDYFVKRGHTQVKAMLPRFRRGNSDTEVPTTSPEILDELENKGYITYTPSRFVKGKLIVPYDDRFILTAASFHNAIIVSNDNYRDLYEEKPEWKRLVESNLLQYSFIGDLFMVADDPMGRRGPNINQFLSIQSNGYKKCF
jgi:ribonuclease ZC3H12